MKKVAIIVSVLLGFSIIQPAHADNQQVLAIIDTAVDSNKLTNVVYEACFTLKTCPNGTSFQEGKGSANVSDWTIKGIDHGYNISQAATLANPNIKIVFIRISDVNVYSTFSAIHNDGTSLDRAIDWVSKNASKYSIDAVSISQSRINFTAGTCPIDITFTNAVNNLNAQNVPTFAATGNDGKKNQVGFPACSPGVIGIGALKPTFGTKPYPANSYTAFASYTNIGPELDMVARGDADVKAYGGWDITITGTSVASPIAASILINRYDGKSWNTTFSILTKVLGYPYASQ